MNLHENKSEFRQLIYLCSNSLNIIPSFIEKDYYVTLLLKELFTLDSNFVFKGGTSLSKCYKIINRFSEDIDINYHPNIQLTQGTKKKIKEIVRTAVANCKLEITNLDNTRSKRLFNQYLISYQNIFLKNSTIKDKIILETAFQQPPYPFERIEIQSIIGEYLVSLNRDDLVSEFHLEPFSVNVQSLDRTFIDKVFALCDYYLTNKIKEHSRHLYDLHKLFPNILFDDSFFILFQKVKEERSHNEFCPSAQCKQNISDLLLDILSKQIYKHDYESITLNLCFDNIPYSVLENTLMKIIVLLQKND